MTAKGFEHGVYTPEHHFLAFQPNSSPLHLTEFFVQILDPND